MLKSGGRFICLEFSFVNDDLVRKLYDLWSFKIIPKLGKIIEIMKMYKYLIESVKCFLIKMNYHLCLNLNLVK